MIDKTLWLNSQPKVYYHLMLFISPKNFIRAGMVGVGAKGGVLDFIQENTKLYFRRIHYSSQIKNVFKGVLGESDDECIAQDAICM